jgi:hypothetical protein
MPHLLHVVPVRNHAIGDGVFQIQDTSFFNCFIADEAVFLIHAYHYPWLLRTTDYSRKDPSWGIVSGKACLDDSSSVINYNGTYVFALHFSNY